jgi:hypothetical protein
MEAAMHGFTELAKLLAAPSIMGPRPSRKNDDSDEDGKPRQQEPDGQRRSHDVDEFEHMEVGDPRDGP